MKSCKGRDAVDSAEMQETLRDDLQARLEQLEEVCQQERAVAESSSKALQERQLAS